MKDRINVAELLKYCPKGMELDCTMYDDVKFIRIEDDDKPICIRTGDIYCYLTKFGTWTFDENAKCVIFPKGKTTWEGFQRPFKDGDIVYTIGDSIAILGDRIGEHSVGFRSYCGLFNYEFDTDVIVSPERFATEEEKAKLFQAIRANGYKWNPETKTLETLVEFKDGDVIANDRYIAIFHKFKEGHMYYHCWYNNDSNNSKFKIDFGIGYIYEYRLASEKEKEKLFNAIKANGYKWDNVTKVLYKIVEPKFNIGDIIKDKCNLKWKVIDVNRHYYEISLVLSGTSKLLEIKAQDDYELVPNKFDITTLKPFDKVLVRMHDKDTWCNGFYSFYKNNHYFVNSCILTRQCIPYEYNEHLLGTTDDCDEFYKNWE